MKSRGFPLYEQKKIVYNIMVKLEKGRATMNCTKCGRETKENAVFCGKCLDVMKQYPIKPGTVIQLPQRKAASPKKAVSRRRLLSPEETVVRQRKTIKWLWVALACTLLLLCLSVALLFHLNQEQESAATIGQNYSTRDASVQR